MGDNRSPVLSDAELRRKLKDEFNFNCGPVTDSTRSIYLKKLDNFIRERNKETNSRRHTVASFESSLNHDSNDDLNSSNISANVRQSPRNAARRSVAAAAINDNHENGRLTPVKEYNSDAPEIGRKPRLSPKQSTPKVNDSLATRNTRRRTMNSPVSVTTNSPRRRTLAAPNATLNSYSSEESEDEELEGGGSVLYNYMTSRKPKQTDSPMPHMRSTPTKVPLPRVTPPRTSPVNAVTTPFATRRSTRGKISPPITATSFLANYSDSEAEIDAVSEPTSTESIRDRLLKHRQTATRRKTDIGYKKSNNSPIVVQANEYSDDANFYSSANGSSSSNIISFTILCLVIAFFVFILSLYVYSRFSFASFGRGDPVQLELDVNAGSNIGIIAPICENGLVSNECFLTRDNVTAALFLVKSIQNFIQRFSYQYLCEDNGRGVNKDDPFVFEMAKIRAEALLQKEKFLKFIGVSVDDQNNEMILFKSLNDAIRLIQLNTQWNIEVEPTESKYFLRIDPDTYQSSLPFSCRVRLYLAKTMKYISLSMIVIAVVWAVFTYVHRKKKQAAELKEQVYDLVEKSLDLLQSPDNPQSMPVIHIRDMLFSTQERQSAKFMKIWDKVVSFIEEHESRVKVSVERIDGEEYKTWKWISNNKGNTSCEEGKHTTMKTGTIEWQGQAFCEEGQAGDNSVNETVKQATANSQANSSFFAPTRFLKVRNMFTAETQLDPNWKVNIENAILEKCASNSPGRKHGVLHICVEDQDSEGIVYIKCDSRESATDAFHALHGWWCERKLVSVKFLKEERYYSRFPEARCFNVPLQIRNVSR